MNNKILKQLNLTDNVFITLEERISKSTQKEYDCVILNANGFEFIISFNAEVYYKIAKSYKYFNKGE